MKKHLPALVLFLSMFTLGLGLSIPVRAVFDIQFTAPDFAINSAIVLSMVGLGGFFGLAMWVVSKDQ